MEIKANINYLADASKGNLRALASVSIGDSYAIHGIKVLNGEKGNFISMPSLKGNDGKFHDTFHPITAEARENLNNAVMEAYKQEVLQNQSALIERQNKMMAEMDGSSEGMSNDFSDAGNEKKEDFEDIFDEEGPSYNLG